ncbi:MAG: hypothetical protein ACK56F_00530, partial [bacterium]
LINGTVYTGATNYNVGLAFRQTGLYNSLFDSTGKFIGNEITNINLTFEMSFTSKNSVFRQLRSFFQILNDEGFAIDATQIQGLYYITAQNFNEAVYYSVGPFKCIIDYGQSINLNTNYDFTTGSEGTLTRMSRKITIERNVY